MEEKDRISGLNKMIYYKKVVKELSNICISQHTKKYDES